MAARKAAPKAQTPVKKAARPVNKAVVVEAPKRAPPPDWAVYLMQRFADRMIDDPAFRNNLMDFSGVPWKVDLDNHCIHRQNGRRIMTVNDREVAVDMKDFPGRGAHYAWPPVSRTAAMRPNVRVN